MAKVLEKCRVVKQAVRGIAHRTKRAHLLSSCLELLTLQGHQVTGPREGLQVVDGKAGTAAGEVCSETRQQREEATSFPVLWPCI